MEKKTLLAIALSIFVLYAYNMIVPQPVSTGNKRPQSSQIIENKEDTINNSPEYTKKELTKEPAIQEAAPLPASPKNKEKEIIQTIANKYLTVEFSNIGGSIKSVTLNHYGYKFPLTDILKVEKYDQEIFFSEIEDNKITFTFRDNEFKISKIFTVSNDGYTIKADIEVKNNSEMSKVKGINFVNFTIDNTELIDKKELYPEHGLFEYSAALSNNVLRKNNAFKFQPKEKDIKPYGIRWAGYRNRYYCAVVKANFANTSFAINPISDYMLSISTITAKKDIPSGESIQYESLAYFGPQDYKQMKTYKQGFEEITVFSNYFILDIISKGILNMMYFIHGFIPNWGLTIILISLIIYAAMYPLTMKSMVSMKRMQNLQPKIAQLREQLKSNPQKLNKEIMELYKLHKVNPFGGCLPMLLQMPIFIGLYQVLWRTVAFKGSSFLWIKDLSEPDRLFILPTSLPIIGNEINIMPVLMAAVMFFQQKFSMAAGPTGDPSQDTQQRIMKIFFPIFIGFIFYHFASGLNLYFTVFYILSALAQWKMSKLTPKAA